MSASADARRAAAAVAGAVLLAALAHGAWAATSEAQQAEICAEAEQRYREAFGGPSAGAPVAVVTMYKFTFCPVSLKVKAGATVRWVNVDRRTTHSIWFKDAGRSESDRVFGGDHVEMTIDLPPGEHRYLCGPHWQMEGMIGTLTVEP